MRINNNITALNSHRQYGINNNNIAKSVEKLSSGYRINRAGDDAAGLAISEKMRAQVRGLNMASKNSQDAISLIQTAEGAMQTAHDILQRMREIAVQSASDTNETTIDRAALDLEFQQLNKELTDLNDKTKFNDMSVLGSTGAFTIQTGANQKDILTFSTGSISAVIDSSTSKSATVADTTGNNKDTARTNASAAIGLVNKAINSISTARATLGAMQNRLEFKIQSLDISAENLAAAESRIRDVDMAKQMTTFTKNNILFQASTAMLAQANALPQGVLQLLG